MKGRTMSEKVDNKWRIVQGDDVVTDYKRIITNPADIRYGDLAIIENDKHEKFYIVCNVLDSNRESCRKRDYEVNPLLILLDSDAYNMEFLGANIGSKRITILDGSYTISTNFVFRKAISYKNFRGKGFWGTENGTIREYDGNGRFRELHSNEWNDERTDNYFGPFTRMELRESK